jgi:hypothetical protein
MPWVIRQVGPKKWRVQNQDTGRVTGTFSTLQAARDQQKALYANVPESRPGRALTDAAKRRRGK